MLSGTNNSESVQQKNEQQLEEKMLAMMQEWQSNFMTDCLQPVLEKQFNQIK